MKVITLSILILTTICSDECLQYTSYKKCIDSFDEQCQWVGQFCRMSNNYLLGCNANLSSRLCVKQLGNINGTVAECIFDSHCHEVYDKHHLKCSEKISKSACLSITNPQQFCKWNNGQCLNLSQEELNSLQNNFSDLELSASTCGLIDGYLIIHNSLLWNIVEYSTDLFTEALNQIHLEAGAIITISTNYNETATLQDNFVDKQGQFKWYTTATTLSTVNLKINDYTRYGCIAQEVLTQSRFLMLFTLTGVIRGVNHIYCNYLNKHPSSPILTIFTNNECREVTGAQLQDKNFIIENNVMCQSMGGFACQRFFNPNNKCIINYLYEYECKGVTSFQKSSTCQGFLGTAIHFTCAQVDSEACYMDISSAKGYCTNQCYKFQAQVKCETDQTCIWLGQNLYNITDSSSSQFTVCAPLNGCDQLGLNKNYCLTIAMNCVWDEQIDRCKSIQYIEQLKCQSCNTIYCCSSIIRFDQFCIWKDNQCLNVQDQPLFSHFYSFPTSVIMNFNLCVSQTGQYNYYDTAKRTCLTSGTDLYTECIKFDDPNYQIDNLECNNGFNDRINQEYCLSLINSFTRWDKFKLKCIHVANKNIACDQLKQVNQNLCKYAIIDKDRLCLYDSNTWSCYSSNIVDLHCDTKGISRKQCLENQVESCQWIENQCKYFEPHQIESFSCRQLMDVTQNVCRFSNFIEDQCQYDAGQYSCTITFNSQPICAGNWNYLTCRHSKEACYFNNITNQCQNALPLIGVLKCDTDYISKATCLAITTKGERCYWGSILSDSTLKCRKYQAEFYTECNSYKETSNINQCSGVMINIALNLTADSYCEVVDKVCQSKTDSIADSDCGFSSRIMNLYRCMGYTSEQCYFENYKCTPLQGPAQYKKQLLQQLTCEQSNMNLCAQILTPGQVCFKETNVKCRVFSTVRSLSCTQLQFDMTIFSPQLCSIATDECYFDEKISRCKMPNSGDQFECNQIGSSKTLCIAYTKGICVFVNQSCQNLQDLTVSCGKRNKRACTVGSINCQWDSQNNICSFTINSCLPDYGNTNTWQICESSVSICFAGRNGCVEDQSDYIPCWLSLSQDSCSNQTKFCQWIDNRCIDNNYKCEDAISLQQCVLHKSLNCVFKNSRCFEVTSFDDYQCSDFDYTTALFCRYYYPACILTDQFVCKLIFFLANSRQIDSESLIYGSFSSDQPNYSCLLQRSEQTVYYSDSYYPFCGVTQDPFTVCEYFDQNNQYSILMCESLPNCGFAMTVSGLSFCHTLPLACEQLNEDFCIMDIPGISCYLNQDDYTCNTYVRDRTCSSVEGLQVNKQLCLSIMENQSNTEACYYDEINNMCKQVANQLFASDCLSIDDIYACTFAQLPCINNYDASDSFSSCSDSLDQFDTNLNILGCTQLNDDLYYFNLNSYTCVLYTEIEDDNIAICRQLNQKLCLSTKLNVICVWSNQCETYKVIYQNFECEFRNYFACLHSQEQDCAWIQSSHQCVSKSLMTNQCDNNECYYSESYCISIHQLWDGKLCYSYSSDLPRSFYKCEGLGLGQDLCLNNTQNLNCYWNGKSCLQASLDMLQCDANVSEQTCLSIVTPKQICLWANSTCVNKYNSTSCGDYIQLFRCRQATVSCQFNLASNICEEKKEIDQYCSNTLSQGACINVEQQYCMWNNKQCQRWSKMRYTCDQIFNRWGCYHSSMYCQWTTKCENIDEIEPMPCQSIPRSFNKAACSKYSSGPCLFDERTERCDIKLSSAFPNSLNADQSGFSQIRLFYECTQFSNSEDCIQSRRGVCEWLNSSCINCAQGQCSAENCLNQNQNQCMNLQHLECAWRNNRCVTWTYDVSFTLAQLSLITQKCCTQLAMLIKYDLVLQSCIPLDINNDNCQTLGLSQYACLHLIKAQCFYKDGICQSYEFEYQESCTDYANISQQVCQQLPHLSCKFDISNYKCIDIDKPNDSCLTIGISLFGCSNLVSEPCYWNKDQCAQFILNPLIDQCDNSTRTNGKVCQILNYYSTCSFNQDGRTCIHKFNRHSQCKEPGLNKIACTSIIREPCQYKNNQCQLITNLTLSCNELSIVNELACQMNKKDSCGYDSFSNNCFFTLSQLPCNYPGLNINSCKSQSFCSWSYDNNQCQCNTLTTSSVCALNDTSCKNQNNCKYEHQGGYCRIQHCDDLSDCQGFVNGERCYLNYSNECQGATRCEDIVNLNNSSSCKNYVFDGSSCIQMLNYCISATNLSEICINSDCSSTQCKMSNFQCNPLQCTDYSKAECKFYKGCTLIDGKCLELFTCSAIQTQDICVSASAGEMQCFWELSDVYLTTHHCTNTFCSLYNVSPTLCNGNEINIHSCFMDQFQQCRICEEISDQCTCSNSNGACTYQNGVCRSILCLSFVIEIECSESSKCYWSTTDKVCRKKCKKIILQDECEALSYECHWNEYQYKCEQGVAVKPDLSVTVILENIYSPLILPFFILLFIQS